MSQEIEYKYEEMANFFNERAKTYENHMRETVNSFDVYYDIVSSPIKETKEPIEILDLGCGTGLEISSILKKAPNAKITCIDMSDSMLDILLENYKDNKNQITIIKNSYLTFPFDDKKYDYVIAVMTMHHFLHDEKRKLYEKIKRSLKEGGKYIEGDYVVSQQLEEECLKVYRNAYDKHGLKTSSLYHIDIPFSMETQKKLFIEAGFGEFEIVFMQEPHTIYFVK